MAQDKITYILGAGASIGAFPLVKGTKEWNNKGLAECLVERGTNLKQAGSPVTEFNDTVIKIAKALEDTGNNAIKFGNVDTYAKYLYHTLQKDELAKLKLALTYYFVERQLCERDKINEKKYLNFITSIITERNQFPNHVKILNWNYDFLLQDVGSLYRKESFHVGVGATIHSPAFIEYFPQCGYEFNQTHPDIVSSEFSLVHLNGIAGFYLAKNTAISGIFHSIFNDLLGTDTERKIHVTELLKAFHDKYAKNPHLITFAWEKRSESKALLINNNKIAQEIIKGTTILVIIGYSFPFYNREVDNMIFETITPTLEKIYFQDPHNEGEFLRKTITPTLEKIYFQDPHNEGEFLRKRYDLQEPNSVEELGAEIRGVNIEDIRTTEQFYIPVEV